MGSENKPVTIKDVARTAGVSASTVSKVLNDAKTFPDETRAKVIKAARQVGYVPNPYAQSIVTGRTRVIGVKILDIANPYFSNIVKGAQRQAFDEGYNLVVADSQEDPDIEIQALQELARRSDGLVLAGSRLSAERLGLLNSMPTVLIGRTIPNSSFVCIHHPFEERLSLAIEHLVYLGHQRIAVVLPQHLTERTESLDRYRDQGLSVSVMRTRSPDMHGGEEVGIALLARTPLPTAVVGYNDLVCYGLIRAARRANIRIPEDFSLIGSDNLAFNDITEPPLTSISGDQIEVGRKAIDILARWIREGKHTEQTISLKSRVVIRASTAGPRTN